MRKKIIGVTVGSPLPKPNLKQTDPRKGDYVKGKDIIPSKVSELENDSGFLTEHQDISGKLDADKLPEAINTALANAKASGDFDGEPGYTPRKGIDYFDGQPGYTPQKGVDYFDGDDYVLTPDDKSEIAEMAAELVDVPESGGNVAYDEAQELTDEQKAQARANIGAQPAGNYLTEHQALADYAKKTDIPSVPVKSVNGKTENVKLNASDVGARPDTWMPTASDVGALPSTTKIPAKTSDLTNDSGFITGYTETDPTVPSWAKASSKPSYSKSEVGLGNVDNVKQYSASNPPPYPVTSVNGKTGAVTVTVPTVPTKVSAFENDKGYLTQHQDISGKADKDKLTLRIHTDGLMYLFVDGNPVGAGIELSAGGVSGYVDENNNIILSNLPDGTYTVKYEMEDGSTVEIGNLVLDSNVYYTVTNNLTNCVSSNSASEAIGGEPYSAVISANSGYELVSVTVTNGDESVPVTGGVINIAEVKGNIVITAVAEVSGPAYTNLAQPDATASGETAWNTGGWCNDSYMAGSSYAYRNGTGRVTTNTIAVEHGDTIYVKGIKYNTDSTCQIAVFKADGSYLKHASAYNMDNSQGYIDDMIGTVGEDYWQFTNTGNSGTDLGVRFIRIAGYLSGTISDVIITRNEPIV